MRTFVVVFTVLVALTTVASETSAQSAKSMVLEGEQAVLFNEISDALVCQCGCQMILRVCNHENCPSAIPLRREIEKQIIAGAPADSIIAGFVAEYGEVILSSPPVDGFNLAAWVMPGFALIVGVFLVAYYVGSFIRRRKAVEIVPGADADAVDDGMRQRLEAELAARED